MSDWSFDNERRSNFRVEEQAYVQYQLLETHYDANSDVLNSELGKLNNTTSKIGLSEEKESGSTNLEDLFPRAAQFDLIADLRSLDDEAEQLLRRVAEIDKSTAGYLRLLNKKIDRIAQSLNSADPQGVLNTVTLSEGGISLDINQHQDLTEPDNFIKINEGQQIALKILLLPEYMELCLKTETVYVLPLSASHYRIGCRFVDLDDQQQHLLGRHIIESQARQRRQQRDKN